MKRFTDTEKWRDPWFRRLPPEHKLAWQYLCDNCDNAGVWVVDWDLFNYLSGVTVDPSAVLAALDGRARDIGKGRWWIPKFVPFQFGELVEVSRVHQSVLTLLRRHGIYTLWIDYLKAIGKGLDTPKDKDKDKDKDSGKGSGETQPSEVLSLDQVKAAVMTEGIPDKFAELVYDTWRLRGGRDGCNIHVPVVEYVRVRWHKEGADWRNGIHRAQKGNSDGANRNNGKPRNDRNAGTHNDPSRYSPENLRKSPNYHGPSEV